MLQIALVLINGRIDDDGPEPAKKRSFVVVLVQFGKDLQKTIVEDFRCLVPITGVSEGDAHAIGIIMPVQQFLAFTVFFQATPDKTL